MVKLQLKLLSIASCPDGSVLVGFLSDTGQACLEALAVTGCRRAVQVVIASCTCIYWGHRTLNKQQEGRHQVAFMQEARAFAARSSWSPSAARSSGLARSTLAET